MTSRAAAIMSVLLYAQGLLIVAAIAAVIMRMPSEETRSAADVVASLPSVAVAQ